jgi:hypothetical protein
MCTACGLPGREHAAVLAHLQTTPTLPHTPLSMPCTIPNHCAAIHSALLGAASQLHPSSALRWLQAMQSVVHSTTIVYNLATCTHQPLNPLGSSSNAVLNGKLQQSIICDEKQPDPPYYSAAHMALAPCMHACISTGHIITVPFLTNDYMRTASTLPYMLLPTPETVHNAASQDHAFPQVLDESYAPGINATSSCRTIRAASPQLLSAAC